MAASSVKFVSQKISKIRWRPRSRQSLQPSNMFVTGSWDDEVNKLCFMQLEVEEIRPHSQLTEELAPCEPKLLWEADHLGDVMDLCFVTQDTVASASSSGSLLLYQHHTESEHVQLVQEWKRLHADAGRTYPCTAVASWGQDTVATGGEDGRITQLAPDQGTPVRVLENADSCTVNDLIFLTQAEVLAVNAFGQVKVFDLRQPLDTPAQIFSATEERWSLLCVDKHPGQPHIVATGGQDGMLTVWDLRQHVFPMTLLEAHSSSVLELRFHPHHADHLFTCSEDGSLWHWDGSALVSGSELSSGDWTQTPWLGLDLAKNKLEITSLLPNKSLPVNTLDIEGPMLVCGTDSETIYSVFLPQLV